MCAVELNASFEHHAEPRREPLARGSVLARRYRVLKLLGAGGMATVYEGEHIELRRRVAIKVLHAPLVDQPEMCSRFRREAQVLARIRSEHVVAVQDVGDTDLGLPFLVMELLEGNTLRALLRKEHMLPVPRAAALAVQICRGLAAAHELEIVHRDLKPENLLITLRSDGTDWVKILDFGIAKLLSGSNDTLRTEPTFLLGTPCYMSPERVESDEVTEASDIHSVGLILYECLAGCPAFRHAERVAVLVQILKGLPQSLSEVRPELPEELVRIVERALAPDPRHRFKTAEEMANALLPFAGTDARNSFASLPESAVTMSEAVELPIQSKASSVETSTGFRAHRVKIVATGLITGVLAAGGIAFAVANDALKDATQPGHIAPSAATIGPTIVPAAVPNDRTALSSRTPLPVETFVRPSPSQFIPAKVNSTRLAEASSAPHAPSVVRSAQKAANVPNRRASSSMPSKGGELPTRLNASPAKGSPQPSVPTSTNEPAMPQFERTNPY